MELLKKEKQAIEQIALTSTPTPDLDIKHIKNTSSLFITAEDAESVQYIDVNGCLVGENGESVKCEVIKELAETFSRLSHNI